MMLLHSSPPSRINQAVVGLLVWLFGGNLAGCGTAGGTGPPRPPISWWESPWWNDTAAQGLNLSDAQKTDINAIVKDYRNKMMDLRSTMEKADKDVAAAFGDASVDQRKANDAIDRLRRHAEN